MRLIIGKYKFDSAAIENYRDDENAEFAIMRLNFLSDGYNSHELPITSQLLKQYAPTILGKPIVAKYDTLRQDVAGHEEDEVIVGYVPQNATINYKNSDNGMFACVDGLISKIYATNVYEMYKDINHRNVSVEMDIEWEGPFPFQGDILSFNLLGVTLLGLDYHPSCTLASSTITKFSLEDVNNYYKQQYSLNDYLQQRRKHMDDKKTYKVNKEELKTTPWGEVDKTKLRNAVMDAANKAQLVHDVYALVEDGWEDAPSEKLKYPIMQLIDDTFYYNRGALSSALGYAKAQGVSSVVSKIEKLYKKFELKEEPTNMEEIVGRDAWGDVIKIVQDHEGKDAFVNNVYTNHIIYTKNDTRWHVKADVKVGPDDKVVDAKIDWNTVKKDAVQKMEEQQLEKSCEELTSDECANMGVEELRRKIEDQKHIIMEKDAELAELRKFKSDAEDEERKFRVNKLLNDIRQDIDEQTFCDLQKEGTECDFVALSAWENKAKAKAYEVSSKRTHHRSDMWYMGGNPNVNAQETHKGLWDAE